MLFLLLLSLPLNFKQFELIDGIVSVEYFKIVNSIVYRNYIYTQFLYRPRVYKLAWASAQIHCLCSVSENRVVVPKSLRRDSIVSVQGVSTDTSFVPAKGI